MSTPAQPDSPHEPAHEPDAGGAEPSATSDPGTAPAGPTAPAEPTEPELFEEILYAPDRDDLAPRPVVSYREDDETEYLDRIDRHATARVPLTRRGAWHGQWAELDRADLPVLPPAAGPRLARGRLTLPPTWRERWLAARPVVLTVLERSELDAFAPAVDAAHGLHDLLAEPGGLRAWLDGEREFLEPDFTVKPRRPTLFDPERDIERVLLSWRKPAPGARAGDGRGPSRRVEDLWLKSGWLSDSEDDRSLRLRFAFGSEGHDDGSRDHLRHVLTAELAERLLPEADALGEHPLLVGTIDALCAEPTLFTQHIAYWNSPEGGALLHHDAFTEDPLGRQLGVCYVQLSGATAWIALSVDDLAERVREFAEFFAEGELAWVRDQLFPTLRKYQRFRKRVFDDRALRRELSLPGCGSLGALVNRGPEFTAFLADAGHAVVLRPGEAVLLPNQGPSATAMHSVFCASEQTAYGLSMAIRAARQPAEPELGSPGDPAPGDPVPRDPVPRDPVPGDPPLEDAPPGAPESPPPGRSRRRSGPGPARGGRRRRRRGSAGGDA